MVMLKKTVLSLTNHEISLIRTSISNYKKTIMHNIRCLNIEDEDGNDEIRDDHKMDLAVLISIQEKITEL